MPGRSFQGRRSPWLGVRGANHAVQMATNKQLDQELCVFACGSYLVVQNSEIRSWCLSGSHSAVMSLLVQISAVTSLLVQISAVTSLLVQLSAVTSLLVQLSAVIYLLVQSSTVLETDSCREMTYIMHCSRYMVTPASHSFPGKDQLRTQSI